MQGILFVKVNEDIHKQTVPLQKFQLINARTYCDTSQCQIELQPNVKNIHFVFNLKNNYFLLLFRHIKFTTLCNYLFYFITNYFSKTTYLRCFKFML